jgi:hypothetical protein
MSLNCDKENHMKKILGNLRPIAHIYACTALMMFIFGALSLGTFPALTLGATLATALAVSAGAWIVYMAAAIAICLPLSIKSPGFVLSTALGAVSGAIAIALTGWLIPSVVLAGGFWAALPFALVNTLTVWGSAQLTGSLRKDLTLWPQR